MAQFQEPFNHDGTGVPNPGGTAKQSSSFSRKRQELSARVGAKFFIGSIQQNEG
jgi:hypothetical protein